MRIEVRELVHLLTGDARKSFEVSINDSIQFNGVAENFIRTLTYSQKVLDYLTENSDHPVLNKIKNIEQLSAKDIDELEQIMWQELGTKEDYERFLNRENLTENCGNSVAAFIRTIVKIDRQKALQMFTEYISANTLSAEQEEYLKNILDYVCENGDMNSSILVNESPFNDFDVIELFPNKIKQVTAFVNNLHDSITAA